MKTYKLPHPVFQKAIQMLRGFVFYRIADNGDCLIKPLKSVEHIIVAAGGVEVAP